jgi:hypothetical protein
VPTGSEIISGVRAKSEVEPFNYLTDADADRDEPFGESAGKIQVKAEARHGTQPPL